MIFDPGIGFGKTQNQNYEIIKNSNFFSKLKISSLIGHSRKRFLDPHQEIQAQNRDLETAIIGHDLNFSNIDYLRIHSPSYSIRALNLSNQQGPQ